MPPEQTRRWRRSPMSSTPTTSRPCGWRARPWPTTVIPAGYTARFLTADRGWRSMGVTVRAVRDDDGVVVGRVANLRDIQEQVDDRAALSRSERRFRLALESAPVGMAVVDLDRRFVEVNPALCELARPQPGVAARPWCRPTSSTPPTTRSTASSAPTSSPADPPRSPGRSASCGPTARSCGCSTRSACCATRASRCRSCRSSSTSPRPRRPARTCSPWPPTTRSPAWRTGPPLLDEIERARHSAERSGGWTGLAILDLDHFKYVNDSMGHAFGDELIRAAARRIEKVARAGDLVARLGGDEFVVVMRDLHDPTEAGRVAVAPRGGVPQPAVRRRQRRVRVGERGGRRGRRRDGHRRPPA